MWMWSLSLSLSALITLIWTNMANVLRDSDNLNELSSVQYVLIGKTHTHEWTDFLLFRILYPH